LRIVEVSVACSLACAVFFTRDPTAREEPPERTVAKGMTALDERQAQFLHRDVRRLGQQRRFRDGEGTGRLRLRHGRDVLAQRRH